MPRDWDRWAQTQARVYEDAMERLGAGMARSAQTALVQAYRRLEGELARLYNRAVADGGLSFALQRNQLMMSELEVVFERFQLPADLQQQVSESMARAREFGRSWAQESLNEATDLFLTSDPAYARELVSQSPAPADDWLYRAAAHREGLGVTGGVDLRAAIAAQDLRRYEALRNYHAMARFNRTRDDVAERIQNVISVNVAQGTSWRKVERGLREVMGAASSRAGMVARTEIAAASGEAMRQEYESRGVELVQLMATMDSRTSDICASRNRNIYRLGEITVPLHPHCRSTLMPVSQRMIDRGIIDPQREAAARAEGLTELEAAGRKPNSGPAPFEKSAGQGAPTPVWEPPATRALSGSDGDALGPAAKGLKATQSPFGWVSAADLKDPADLLAVGAREIDDVAPDFFERARTLRGMEAMLSDPDLPLEMRQVGRGLVDGLRPKLLDQARAVIARGLDTPLDDAARRELRDQIRVTGSVRGFTRADLNEGIDTYSRLFNGRGMRTLYDIEVTRAQRAYRDTEFLLTSDRPTLLHEMAHGIEEEDGNVRRLTVQWMHDRARTTPLETMAPDSWSSPAKGSGVSSRAKGARPAYRLNRVWRPGYDDDEIALLDSWVDPYVGKVYAGNEFTEVVSMGAQMFHSAEDLLHLATWDPEHLQLIMGLTRLQP